MSRQRAMLVAARGGAATAPAHPPADPQPDPQTKSPPCDPQDRVRQLAYRLYEERGCTAGHALDDWLAAETQLGQQAASAPRAART